MAALDRLPWPLPSGLTVALLACAVSAATAGWFSFNYAAALGDAALATLKTEYSAQALAAEQANRVQLLQQVSRAQQSESLLFDFMTQHANEKQQLQERIPHVTTQYRPARGAVAEPIPHCVFTVGWLRDFNAALGVRAPRPGAAATAAEKASRPAAGADAELLESGVTPADILAHAQDYGLWARTNLTQLNALLDLQKKD